MYCKYRYLEGHEFKTPEEEVNHFLHKVNDKDWKWSEQYEKHFESDFDDEESDEEDFDVESKQFIYFFIFLLKQIL